MTTDTEKKPSLAAVAVRLAALWILTGALAKLFKGTPKDLPKLVRDLTPFGLDLTFHLVISVELAIVSLALAKPKLAWPIVLALFGFFDFVLVTQLAAGASSCGCFGATIKVSPWFMLGVDSVLILMLLASRPWSRLVGPGLNTALLAIGLVVSGGLPWLVIRAPNAEPSVPGKPTQETARYLLMDPPKWVGHTIDELAELTRWVPLEKVPTDGKIVLWRQGCEHCAAHLRLMAGKDDGSQPILLLQIRDDLKTTSQVDAMPSGPHVTSLGTQDNLDIVVTTPMEIRVEGGVVKAALDEEHAKVEYEKAGG